MTPALSITHIPNVSDLAPGMNGEALLISGYGATWDLDRVGDAFDPHSLDAAVTKFMATNPVLCYAHQYDKPPIGKVIEARIDREHGVYFKALMPRPPAGTWSEAIWWAAKQGILKALSIGGKWTRQAAAGFERIVAADLLELSLAPIAVNGAAFASEAASVRHVKAVGGRYVDADCDEFLASASRQLDLAEVRLDVAAMRLR
jgi:hypothetical protein